VSNSNSSGLPDNILGAELSAAIHVDSYAAGQSAWGESLSSLKRINITIRGLPSTFSINKPVEFFHQ
jgi:hypothetical protein